MDFWFANRLICVTLTDRNTNVVWVPNYDCVRSAVRPANVLFMDLHDLHTSVLWSKQICLIDIVVGREFQERIDRYVVFCGLMFVPAIILSQPNFKVK